MTSSAPDCAEQPDAAAARAVGRPARINKQMVVEAAAALDPGSLTFQAVADELGVGRRALGYYVSGRDELMQLVAARVLAQDLKTLALPDGDWREAVRAFAAGMRRAMLKQSALSTVLDRLPEAGVLGPSDELLGRLIDAGFAPSSALQALTLLSKVVFTGARETVRAARAAGSSDEAEVRRVLAETPEHELTTLRRLIDSDPIADDVQAQFEVDVVIAGLERLLLGQRAAPQL